MSIGFPRQRDDLDASGGQVRSCDRVDRRVSVVVGRRLRVAVRAELAVVSWTAGVGRRRRLADAGDLERRRPARTCSGRRRSPGVAVSSPIVWGDRVFVSTAVSSDPTAGIRTGLYGDVEPAADVSKHSWRLIALDKRTGKVVWDRVASRGHAEDQASSEIEPGLGHAGHRRHARDRVVRIGGTVRLRLRRQAALEARPRRAQRGLVLRSRLRVGHSAARRSSGRTW